jgi:tetratricopeptide (TPR) repeat protein
MHDDEAGVEGQGALSSDVTTDPAATRSDLSHRPDPAPESFGRYRILQRIGAGGMGVVYRAYDPTRDRIVALKTLQQMSPAGLYRLKQEFRALADLSHPNLVPLYELLSDGDRWCFTMELVAGKHLLRYISGDSPPAGLDDQRVSRIRETFAQLADGVSALHAAEKLHRDVKPSNVLVTAAGHVVLLDFGLAADLDRRGVYISSDSHIPGTVAYMSPEQAAGDPLSRASDWYSVGAVLYQALTGRLPFEGTGAEVLRAKVTDEPPEPAAIVDGIPDDLNGLCVELLRRSPSARPAGAVVAARLRAVGGARPAEMETPTPEAPFVGRERELAALCDAFNATRKGHPVVVHIRGESGAGKSALVHRFLDQLAIEPLLVILTGRCYEQESVPFKALDSLIDSLSAYLRRLSPADVQAVLPRDIQTLARVFPVLRQAPAVAMAPASGPAPVEAHEVRRRAAGALRELLARIGDRHPLVLAIDDLQWGDTDSASLLGDLLSPPDPPVFLAIACARSDDAASRPFFRALDRSLAHAVAAHEERMIVVEPLDAETTRDLALKLLHSTEHGVEEMADAIARESGGRPLFVYELVEHAGSFASLGRLPGAGALSLDDALWRRIESLPIESRQLLEILAIAGHPIGTLDACRAAGLTTDDRSILPAMRAARLIRGAGDDAGESIEPYHDRVRESVVGHLSDDTRRAHHRALANTLLISPHVDAERLAIHLDAAGAPDDAAPYFARAALASAEALAFDHAALLYRRALERKRWDGVQDSALRVQLADALANAGRGAEAAREYLAAAAHVAQSSSLELQRRAALQLLTSGHVDDGIATLTPVLEAVGTRLARTPSSALASMLLRRVQLRLRGLRFVERSASVIPADELQAIDIAWSVVIGLSIIDPIRGADFQTRSLLLALKAGEPSRVARALALEAGHLASTGDRSRAVDVLAKAERIATRVDDAYGRAIVQLARSAVSYFDQRWSDSLSAARQALGRLRQDCTGVTWEIDTATAFCLWSLTYMGQIAELNQTCPGLLREARERGDRYLETNLSTQIMTLVRLAADAPDDARADLERVMRSWSQHGYHVQHHDALIAFIPLELYCRDAATAWTRLDNEWSAFRWSFMSRIPIYRTHMFQLRAYCALAMAASRNDDARFLRIADHDARRLRREGDRWSLAFADYVDGIVAAMRKDPQTAVARLGAAITRFDDLQAGLHAAVTRTRLAGIVNDTSADDLRKAADDWFTAQGVQHPARLAAAYAPGPNH